MEEKLKKDFNEVEVSTFIKYIDTIKTQKKRDGTLTYPWAKFIKDEELDRLFRQAKELGLAIDGDSVTLENKGIVKLNFNYQAYKNLVLNKYPEAIFDLQNVYDGDSFKFRKENGKILYTHEIGNPFDSNKKIIGCYCITKVSTGEFIELMSNAEVAKCRAKAKTQSIWNEWESEMFLKTIMKRACKRHFKDIVRDIEKIDNEDYDLDKIILDSDPITEKQVKIVEGLINTSIKSVVEVCAAYKIKGLDEIPVCKYSALIQRLGEIQNDNS